MAVVTFDGASKVQRITIAEGDGVIVEDVRLDTNIWGRGKDPSEIVSISNQVHDVSSPYEIDADETFNVEADIVNQTVDADIYVLVETHRFAMEYNSGSGKWEVAIAASVIGIVSDVTVFVCVCDKDDGDKEACANPITIVAPTVVEEEPVITTLTLEEVPVDIELICQQIVEATLTLEEE